MVGYGDFVIVFETKCNMEKLLLLPSKDVKMTTHSKSWEMLAEDPKLDFEAFKHVCVCVNIFL